MDQGGRSARVAFTEALRVADDSLLTVTVLVVPPPPQLGLPLLLDVSRGVGNEECS